MNVVVEGHVHPKQVAELGSVIHVAMGHVWGHNLPPFIQDTAEVNVWH